MRNYISPTLLLLLVWKFALGQAAQTTPSGTLIANQSPSTAMPASAILELRSTNKGMLPPPHDNRSNECHCFTNCGLDGL